MLDNEMLRKIKDIINNDFLEALQMEDVSRIGLVPTAPFGDYTCNNGLTYALQYDSTIFLVNIKYNQKSKPELICVKKVEMKRQ
jgi:hypothetical protein